jgi:hypothetical protein
VKRRQRRHAAHAGRGRPRVELHGGPTGPHIPVPAASASVPARPASRARAPTSPAWARRCAPITARLATSTPGPAPAPPSPPTTGSSACTRPSSSPASVIGPMRPRPSSHSYQPPWTGDDRGRGRRRRTIQAAVERSRQMLKTRRKYRPKEATMTNDLSDTLGPEEGDRDVLGAEEGDRDVLGAEEGDTDVLGPGPSLGTCLPSGKTANQAIALVVGQALNLHVRAPRLLRPSPEEPRSKPCCLRYSGSAGQCQFATYRASHDESVFFTGLPVGTCQDALDTLCDLYLNDPPPGPGAQEPSRAGSTRPPDARSSPRLPRQPRG